MKIQITEEDIKLGVPKNCYHCPIANALKRQTNKRWYVGNGWCSDGTQEYLLTHEAKKFMIEFDNHRPVRPCILEV